MSKVFKNPKPVIVRAYSGVFFGYLLRSDSTSCLLKSARQIYYWDSSGLPNKSYTCADIATHGLGTGSKVGAPADRAIIAQVGAVFFMSNAAAAILESQKWASR